MRPATPSSSTRSSGGGSRDLLTLPRPHALPQPLWPESMQTVPSVWRLHHRASVNAASRRVTTPAALLSFASHRNRYIRYKRYSSSRAAPRSRMNVSRSDWWMRHPVRGVPHENVVSWSMAGAPGGDQPSAPAVSVTGSDAERARLHRPRPDQAAQAPSSLQSRGRCRRQRRGGGRAHGGRLPNNCGGRRDDPV